MADRVVVEQPSQPIIEREPRVVERETSGTGVIVAIVMLLIVLAVLYWGVGAFRSHRRANVQINTGAGGTAPSSQTNY